MSEASNSVFTRRVSDLLVKEYGEGEQPVILVHGGPGLPGYLESLGREISPRFKIIEYCQRNTPESGSNGKFYTMDEHVEDLRSVIEECSSTAKPIVVGHSWGAILAIRFAAVHPGKVKRLVLLNCGVFDQKSHDVFENNVRARMTFEQRGILERLQRKLEDAKSPHEKSFINLQMIGILTPLYNVDQKSVVNMKISSFDKKASDQTAEIYQSLRKTGEIKKWLARVQDDVVAFHGHEDPIPFAPVLNYIEERIPQSRIHLMQGGGHFLWLDRWTRREFLKTFSDELNR